MRHSESGCICLPLQRTLRDYTHYIPAKVGFLAEVDEQLIAMIDFTKERNSYVALILDVHIKEDLVYDKHDGTLIGFTNLGKINNHLMKFEKSLTGESQSMPTIVDSMLVMMVRGLLKGGGRGHFHNAFLALIFSLGDVETQNSFFKIFEIH